MPDKDTRHDLIGRIYDGALDPLSWPEILEDIAVGFNAICCDLFAVNLSKDEVFFSSLNNRFSIERLQDYHSHYRHIDDRLLMSLPKPAGRAYVDYELIAPEDFLKTEFYNDFYKPHGLRWSLFGLPAREGGLTVGVSIHRPPWAEAFGREDLKRAQALFPHFARAVRLMRRTAAAGALSRASEASLDRLPVGLCILDGSGHPLFHNRTAARLFAQADGLGLWRRGLVADVHEETERLRQAVVVAAGRALSGGPAAGGALTISRPSGRRPYQVIVAPLRLTHHSPVLSQPRAAVLVIVADPDVRPAVPEEVLARFFGFTAAEAALAVQLMQGKSLQEIAESTRRSVNTVRWTLKNVLAKADCHRQVDLVRLLHSAAFASAFAGRPPEPDDG